MAGTARALWAAAMAAALAVLPAGCGGASQGPPVLVEDRSVCALCRMLVSETLYAAACRMPNGEILVFDDVVCLLDLMEEQPDHPPEAVWIRDAGEDVWLDAREAVYVHSRRIRTPMGGGVAALRDRAEAERWARRHEGSVIVSFEALRAARQELQRP